jgi:hypothetical protein
MRKKPIDEIKKIIELVDALPVEDQIELMEVLALKTAKTQPPQWHKAEALIGVAEIAAGNTMTGEESKRQNWEKHLARKAARKPV